jgi:hypothetical protein
MKRIDMGKEETPFIDSRKLLQGVYEAEHLPEDFSPERIVPDFGFNVLNPKGLLYSPVVDIQYLREGGSAPVWPEGKTFAVCLTHDVDSVSLYSFDERLRERWAQIKGRSSVLRKAVSVAGIGSDWVKYRDKEDPFHCYELWLSEESKVGAYSTFFFWPGIRSISKPHRTDCKYDLEDPVRFDGQAGTVKEMIRAVDKRNWEIGLHASWYAFDDADELKRQREALENVLQHDILSVRQHYLHYDIRVTPGVQHLAGFRYDSTLGFNDNVGFRFGTCYPWRLHDLQRGEQTRILEIPLLLQDTAMLSPVKGLRVDAETAFRYFVQITESVERVRGVLTILWHPNNVVEPTWWKLYERILVFLSKRNAWFGTVRDIGEWWERTETTRGMNPPGGEAKKGLESAKPETRLPE